jgi:glycosyltransferase involved in cell wall biosynthesis
MPLPESSPIFSVIIPAYNEEKYLPRTLGAIDKAARQLGEPVEVIVANNMSTDGTRHVAREFGARVVDVEIRCISAVRNQAAASAEGRYLVFVDADDCMSPNMLVAIKEVMTSGRYIGGGVAKVRYDRRSLGLCLTQSLINWSVALSRVSMFLFYTTPEAFAEVGGFDETLKATEDIDFAQRLRALGKQRGLGYKNLRSAHLVKSSRKFDAYGDWSIFRHPLIFLRACRNDQEVVEALWYKNPKR